MKYKRIKELKITLETSRRVGKSTVNTLVFYGGPLLSVFTTRVERLKGRRSITGVLKSDEIFERLLKLLHENVQQVKRRSIKITLLTNRTELDLKVMY